MIKLNRSLPSRFTVRLGLAAALASLLCSPVHAQGTGPQRLAFAGLRASSSHEGQFNAVKTDRAGNLYLLLDQKDGVRLLKTDATAANILAQALLGAAGDIGLAMALDPAGNVYITGTSTSGSLTATSGAAFPNPVDTTVNSFVAKFDSSLNLDFLTFGGSGRTAVSGIAATADAVFLTGLIYGSGLPVTASGIIQAPAYNSSQNGFVEKFSATGRTLLYATYLSGQNGDTSPTAIAADAAENAYIAGFTTATGFPTIAALIPRAQGITSGFLTKLTPAGDGITFSTFIPGAGISSLAIDPSANNLLLSGSIALGQFPVASVTAPLVSTTYQVLVRMPLDGSAVLSSTVLAPGTQSFLTPSSNGVVWVDGSLSTPLLPLTPVASIGSGFAMRVSPVGSSGRTVIDQTARFGGLAATNPNFAHLALTLTSLAVDASDSPVLAGSVAPTASSSLLGTQTFDLPLSSMPTATLPSTVHDAVLSPGTCTGSLCAGSGAYLARIAPTGGASLALSIDASPNILLRNLGSVQATGLTITATGFTPVTTCNATLAAGEECAIALSGTGPGSLTATAANAMAQTASLPALSASTTANTIVFSPKELDFGVQTSTSPVLTRIITVTNLGQQSQTFTSSGPPVFGKNPEPYPFTETASDCTPSGALTTKQLAAGATCHITLGLAASSDPAKDGPTQLNWTIGPGSVLLTGYVQAAALALSATEIDFGTQFNGGLRSPRFLYLSNNSSEAITHTAVALPSGSPFTITDGCPAQLEPHTVCRLQLGYQSPVATSTDSTTLTLDQGLSVLVTGETIPQPGVNGSVANPNLSVSPSTADFANAVVVTGISSSTQTITVQNTGSSAFSLSLALAGDFTYQTSCTASLAAGASCGVVLTFAPSQPGARQGLLSVTAGSGTTPSTVSLSGTGTPILSANNGTLDFGNIPLGQPTVQWYKVSQPFTTLAAATQSATFHAVLVEDIGYGHGQPPSSSFLSATSGSCLNCWLGLQFTPAAAGPQSASLSLLSSTAGNAYVLTLTGNGLSPSGLVLSPVSRDFGTVAVNSSGAPTLFTLTNLNSSPTPITVTTPAVSGDFSLSTAPTGGSACNGPLAQNASCLVQIFFAPTATGQRTGTLTLQTSAGSAASALTGFGAPDPGIAFNPNALVFSNVPGPTSSQQSITVSNTGSGSLQIATPTNANPAFHAVSTCATLAPAATCSVIVTFTPAAATVADTLQLPVTAIIGGNPVVTTYSIPLTGAYTTGNTGLQIVPGAADYGAAPVNALAGTRQYTINNLTAKSLTLDVAIPRQFVLTGPSCAGLAPNASCNFAVSFLPLTNGSITGTLTAQGTPNDGSATVNGLGFLQGYGTGTNTLSVTGNLSPGRIVDFGQVPSGQSVQQVLTLTNTSSTASATTDTTVTIRRLTSQWPFLSTTTCGTTLSIGQSCTVTLSYTPLNQVASGTTLPPNTTDTGTLTIESDAASGPDLINLTGTATPAAAAAPSNTAPLVSFTASDSSLTFDTTAIGFSSAPQTVTLSNTGNTVLHITNLASSPDFTVAGSCPTLVPGASCLLTITFAPQITAQSSTQLASTRAGAIEITSDSSTSLEFLTLVGTASPSTLVFQPGALNFGVALVGSTTTLPIQITNAGTSPAVFNGIATTGDYAATGTCPSAGSPLAPNATCTLQVGFTPTATGVRAGTVSIASSVSSAPLVAKLTGVGAQSHLNINPATLNFSNVLVGATASLSLTLANAGTASITGIAITTSGDYAVTAPCSFTTLSAGASCSVTVAFTPKATGSRPGVLTISSSDPTSPTAIALSGSGASASGLSNAAFTLSVDGGTATSQTIQLTRSAVYTLTVTPVNGFVGAVILNCNAIIVAPNAACSMQPSTVILSGSSQTVVVTINTLTSAQVKPVNLKPDAFYGFSGTTFCVLTPAIFFLWRIRKVLGKRPASLLLALLYTTVMLTSGGCGSGGYPNLRFSPAGTYQYTVTASSTAGTPISQTVTLNLIIPTP